jgi:hypothetical protein
MTEIIYEERDEICLGGCYGISITIKLNAVYYLGYPIQQMTARKCTNRNIKPSNSKFIHPFVGWIVRQGRLLKLDEKLPPSLLFLLSSVSLKLISATTTEARDEPE